MRMLTRSSVIKSYLYDDAGYNGLRGHDPDAGVRPIITLESDLKVVSGDGLTANTAYVLSR